MKRKIYSESRNTMVKIGPKKSKVYERGPNGYRFYYTEKKGYKTHKIYFYGYFSDELMVSPR